MANLLHSTSITILPVHHKYYSAWQINSPVLSIAVVNRYEPSGLSSVPVTVSAWPCILYRMSFFRRSQTYKEHHVMIWCDHLNTLINLAGKLVTIIFFNFALNSKDLEG